MTVTMKDVARAAGVSQTAVSLTLNNRPGHVSRSMRVQINRVAAEMGYRPNLSARMLRGKSGKTIGIIGTLFTVPIHTSLVNSITRGLWNEGYQAILEESHSNPVEEQRRIGDLLARGVDGIIFANYNDIRNFASLPVPSVILGHDNELADFKTNSEYGGKLAGTHLTEHGRRKIGFITSGPFSNTCKHAGLKQALKEAGLKPEAFACIELLHNRNATNEIFNAVKKGADAFFCSNDFIAGKLIALLSGNGIKVPDDVAIIGYDGLSFAEFTQPALTTIVQPIGILAQLSVELILARIKGKKLNPDFLGKKIPPHLLLGGSCGCPCTALQDLYWEGTPAILDKT
jgi:LacI family transcriptional regulator, galactose operon repressor